jgi:hypothetical protein
MIGHKLGNVQEEVTLYNKILMENTQKRTLDVEGEFCLKMCIAYCDIKLGNLKAAQILLDEAKPIINGKGNVVNKDSSNAADEKNSTASEGGSSAAAADTDSNSSAIIRNTNFTITESLVFSRYYLALAEYQKVNGQYNEFYSTALLYLSYTDMEEFSDDEKLQLTVDIAMAGLMSDSIFDFAVFLSSPMMKNLDNHHYSWLKQLITHMNRGDVKSYLDLIQKNRSSIASFPNLANHMNNVHDKIVYLAVLNLVLNLNPHDRNVTFQTIAEHCMIPLDRVSDLFPCFYCCFFTFVSLFSLSLSLSLSFSLTLCCFVMFRSNGC